MICNNCGKPLAGGVYFYKPDKNDDKKFCGTVCMNKHYNEETKQEVSDFWAKYKGWIIGVGIFLILLIVLWIVSSMFSNEK